MRDMLNRCIRSGDWRRQASCILGIALLVAVTLYGRMILAETTRPARLVVYAFSTQEEVLTQTIFPAFERAWEAETGQALTIEGVFGPSGTLAGQINLGAPADVALFSNAQHVKWLIFGKRVRRDTEPVVTGWTPMVIVTRPGNPARIAEFGDLAQPNLRLLHADPRSSGAGEWAVLAEYGSALQASGELSQAESQLLSIWRNVRLLGPSARATLTLFELGAGDAFVTYEQDARLAQERGVPLEIVVPTRTIIAQHVAVVVDDNVTAAERPVVEAFVDYLLGEAGQEAFGRYHMRSATMEAERFSDLAEPFTIEDLGGWSQAYDELVETLWREEVQPRLDLESAPSLMEGRGE
jgi:ABC-type sulfate transport system substrate-binding protein